MDRKKTKISNQDIKYFQPIDARFDPDGLYWGFVLFSMQEYTKERLRDFCDKFVDELVLFSCNDEIIYRELVEPALQDLRAIYCGRSKTSSWKQ